MSRLLAVAVLALAAAVPAAAHSYGKGEVQVRHPWSRASPPGATVAAGYLEIRNTGRRPDRLVGVATPAADRVEMHVLERAGDVVKMREAHSLEVPARQRFLLGPRGSHLMLIGLKQPLAKGDRVPLLLRFEHAGEIRVELEVQAADSRKAHH